MSYKRLTDEEKQARADKRFEDKRVTHWGIFCEKYERGYQAGFESASGQEPPELDPVLLVGLTMGGAANWGGNRVVARRTAAAIAEVRAEQERKK